MGLNTVIVAYALIALLLYTACGAIYRLYLSPIAHFPGRKTAALTFWYEFYFDVIKRGSYVWEIQKMHEKYGTLTWENLMRFYGRLTDFRPYHSHQSS